MTLLALFAFTDFGLYFLASFAWVPLGLFMPVFATGSTTCPTICSNEPVASGVSMTLAGVANNGNPFCPTQCPDYNRTMVTVGHGGPCFFEGFDSSNYGCVPFIAIIDAVFSTSGGNTRVGLSTNMNSFVGNATANVVVVGASPLDCTGLSVTSVSLSSFTNGACDLSAVTFTIVT